MVPIRKHPLGSSWHLLEVAGLGIFSTCFVSPAGSNANPIRSNTSYFSLLKDVAQALEII